nr:hypothetical protein [Tanacetum cinerariifolium]
MGDENPIRTLEDNSKLSHEGYRNTIELPVGNNVYCMKDHRQSFVEYTSSRIDEAGDARVSKFEADFKQQQSKMTNKIDIVLKAITDRITGALPSDTVKNMKLSTSPVLSARSYPNIDPQCSNHIHSSINAITIHSDKQSDSYDEKAKENKEEEKGSPKNIHVNPFMPPDPSVAFITEKVLKFNSFFESLELVPQSSDTEVICTNEDDREVMFIELIRNNDDSNKGEPKRKGVFSTWMAFGGNTHDLGSFEEETNELTDLHQDSPRNIVLKAWRRRRKHKVTPS